MTAPGMPKSFYGMAPPGHLKLPATDLQKTYDWYTSVFPFTKQPKWEHYNKENELFAVMFTHEPTQMIVEIRKHTQHATYQVGWDPVTYGVKGLADLEEWAKWLDHKGVKHSRVLRGVKGWVMSVEDPDGKFVKLYTDEEHEWSNHPDEDPYWLGPTAA